MSDQGKIALAPLLTFVKENAPALLFETRPLLLRARVGDAFGYQFKLKPSKEEFESATSDFKENDWGRLALIADLLKSISEEIVHFEANDESYSSFRDGLVTTAKFLKHLTPDIILQSAQRQEELVRTFLLRMRCPIVGEDPVDSVHRLDRLDYAKALSLVEEATANAEERLKVLRELQEHAEELLQPRGKW